MKEAAIFKSLALFGLLLAFLITPMVLHANGWNQATQFTFNKPVQIPGQVLPAGTYLFEVIPGFDHEDVRISDSSGTKIFALIHTFPVQDPDLFGKAGITLAERGAKKPEAVLAWYYPGRAEGHEFLYPQYMEKELARDIQDTMVTGD
jgi:hypothetical protein